MFVARYRRRCPACGAFLALCSVTFFAWGAPSAVTFEYAPPEWQTAICLPDDPCKSLVDHEGKLLYHFNRQREFGTVIGVIVADGVQQTGQALADPRIPIVRTTRRTGNLAIVEEAFALAAATGGSRNDVLLLAVENTSEAPQSIAPRVVVNSTLGLEKLGDERLRIDGREELVSTHPVSGITFTEQQGCQEAIMTLKSVTVAPGSTVRFAVAYCGGEAIVPEPSTLQRVLSARTEAEAYWRQAALPFDRIVIPDRGIQALIDSSIRNIWQAREIKEGLPAFQVGPTCYRGLWIVDGAFLLEAAAMLGAGEEARAGVQYMLSKQSPSGAFELLRKHYYKENGIVLWTCVRHAILTQDKDWLRSVWPRLEKTVAYIKTLREHASEDPAWFCQGLIPPGFIDGGLLESDRGEYTNVYWNLLGLKAAAGAARWLGNEEQGDAWQTEYDDFYATFRETAQRDMREDAHGNMYLPIMMRNLGEELPQRAQWAFCHGVYPGQLFENDDPLVAGNLAMLAATEQEGMVYGTGWDPTGIWNYFASFYGHAWLWQGNARKAADALYAMANHASPLLAWREEQSLRGKPFRKVGDMPHNWASAEFVRLATHLLALDRGDELHLLEGMHPQWAGPGMTTALRGIATPFGSLDFTLSVSEDAKEALLHIEPLPSPTCTKVVVHCSGWTGDRDAEPVRLSPHGMHDLILPLM